MPETKAQPQPHAVASVSMHDLLAACAAAKAVSTPPRPPVPEPRPAAGQHREAA
ncbi:hypothetical protein AB0L35_22815 [Streptomyces sp. NPDC052309]|uniref:hypothetical protein n=1 Tax=Streptomyces sp. NPDC052309 TaxID=3155421 RepID=UPI00343EECEC